MKTKVIIIGLAALLLAGCLAPASKINHLSVGMSRNQALQIMGPPASVTSDGQADYLNYSLAEGSTEWNAPVTPYEVKIVDGKVASFGRAGSTKQSSPAAPVVPYVPPAR